MSVTTIFESSFPNFNAAPKADNIHHSSCMDIVSINNTIWAKFSENAFELNFCNALNVPDHEQV